MERGKCRGPEASGSLDAPSAREAVAAGDCRGSRAACASRPGHALSERRFGRVSAEESCDVAWAQRGQWVEIVWWPGQEVAARCWAVWKPPGSVHMSFGLSGSQRPLTGVPCEHLAEGSSWSLSESGKACGGESEGRSTGRVYT